MSDGMVYLCFLVSWLFLLGAMHLANRAKVKEAERASWQEGFTAGGAAERAYIANVSANWKD